MFGTASISIMLVTLAALGTTGTQHLAPSDAGSGTDADNTCRPQGDQTVVLDVAVLYYGFGTPILDPRDFYSFSIESKGDVTVTMNPGPALPDGGPAPNYNLQLLDDDCVLFPSAPKRGNEPESLTFFLEQGRYHVGVVSPNGLGLPVVQSQHAAAASAHQDLASAAAYCDPTCLIVGYSLTISPPAPA